MAGSLQTGDRRVRPRLGLRPGTPLASRGVPGERGHLSSCIWNLGVFSGRCKGESLPLRVDFIHTVHIGCPGPDVALYLLHSLSRFLPHFIALSASSPFVQGVDTGFDSARLNSVFAFPLSGRAPFVETWTDFQTFFEKMTATGVVESMKDFYWDIRPKPEYGTVEVREIGR